MFRNRVIHHTFVPLTVLPAEGRYYLMIFNYLMPGSTLVQKLPGLKFLLFKLLEGKVELVTARCGVILVLGNHSCSLAVCVVLYLTLPGKATRLEAPEERKNRLLDFFFFCMGM